MATRLRSTLGVTFIAAMIAAVAYGQVVGSIAGVISGPGGPLQGLTVNVVNAAGQAVGTATTAADGSYAIGNIPAGTYTVQAVSANGSVLATSMATISAGATAATANITLTASQLAAAGVAAGTGGRLSTAAILGIVAGAGATVATVIALRDDPSATQ